MKTNRIITVLAVALMALTACTKEESPYVTLSGNESYNVPCSGDVLVFKVSTNQSAWEYDLGDSGSWISAFKSGTELRLTVSANTGYSVRNALLKVTAGAKAVAEVKISQAASDVTPELALDGEGSRELPYVNSETLVKAKTNLKTIECSTDADWLAASVDGFYITVKADANSLETVRTAKLTVYAPDAKNPVVSAQVEFVQAAAPPKFPTENLSEGGSSNSYLLSHYGTYTFDATVRGNGKTVEGLSDPKPLSPTSAKLVWQTSKTMVKSVSYDSGKIAFEINDVPGNALIAAVDKTGKILWSWHVWYPGTAPEELLTSEGSVMMDRNLGALTTDHTTPESFGLLYQWGRKDPFPGSPIMGGGTIYTKSIPVYDIDGKEVKIEPSSMMNTSDNTLAYSIANPTVCLSNNAQYSSCRDWLVAGSGNGSFWGNPKGFERVEGEYVNKGSKTYYDPCPKGWRVPHASVFKVMSSLSGMIWATGTTDGVLTWTSLFAAAEFYGVDINNDGLVNLNDYTAGWHIYVNKEKGIHSYFPATTRFDGQYAMFMGSMVGLWANYWYNSPSDGEENSLAMAMSYGIKDYGVTDEKYSITFSDSSNASRADAFAVRCIKED